MRILRCCGSNARQVILLLNFGQEAATAVSYYTCRTVARMKQHLLPLSLLDFGVCL